MLPVGQIKAGTYTGTGAALTITTGFRPTFVIAFNQTEGDVAWFFIDGMTAATGCAISTAAAAVTNGCTLSSTGFSLGTDSTINESAKVYLYFACGGASS